MLTQTAAGRTYDFSHAVGGLYMPQPVAVEVGSDGVVYVVSRQYEQILDVPWNKTATFAQINKFTIGTIPGDEEHVGKISKYGDSEGELIWPTDLALDSDGNLYVTDEWMNRVSVFSKEGDFLNLWGQGRLEDLQQGDPVPNVDYRSVYSTILEDWMGMDSTPIVDGTFEKLGFISS